MDNSANIIKELTQGLELAMQLKSILSSEPSYETKHGLIQQIISSYDRALLMVTRGDSGGHSQSLALRMPSQPESPVSVDESPRSQDVNHPFDGQQEDHIVSKKRKEMPTWQNQIRISTANGLEGSTDDGYSWRKYGQKDILGSKFPRSYYRCTYRYIHHCMAKKQVQRTNEDPTVFEITYKGQHTCNPTTAPPQSPEKHEINQNNDQLPLPPKSDSNLDAMIPSSFSFPSASFGSIQNYHFLNETDYGIVHGGSPSFISLAASGSNYFTESSTSYLQHHDDSNILGITATSVTNSPLAFPADPQDLSQNFPFNNSGYFI